MILNKYNKYLITEAVKGERKVKQPDQKLILSDKFRKVLEDIQNIKTSNISKRLLELESGDRLFDLSYVDVSEDGENVSYLQSSRIERLKSEGKPLEEYWTSKMRTTQKISRFITQILSSFSEDSVQKFVKKFKVVLKEGSESGNFEMVDGDEIIYWYDYRNYEDHSKGSLGGSCMSGPESGRYLNCYRNNPNQCKMLILKNKDGDKIKGRALVWKLSVPVDKIFMDRIYTNEDEDIILFTNYAKKNEWLYKNEQKYGGTYIVFPDKSTKEVHLEVKLDNIKFNRYPYVDTLRYFYPELQIMSSDTRLEGDYYTLTDTEGYYEEYNWEGSDPLVYDGYNKKKIPESRAVWCKYDNGYIAEANAIRLSYNGTFAYPDSPHIVHSTYRDKTYAKEDCDFSEPLNTWIWNKYSVQVYHDRNRTQKPDITHRFEKDKTIGKVGDFYYDIDILQPIGSKFVLENGKRIKVITYDFK